MCSLCTLPVRSKVESDKDSEKVLRLCGGIRRRIVHENKTSSKDHRLPDRLRDREWRVVENRKLKSERKLRITLRDLFEEEIQTLVDRLKEKTGQKLIAYAKHKLINGAKAETILPNVTDILLDWAKWFDRTKSEMKPIIESIAEDGFQSGLERIGTQGPEFTSGQPVVRTTLNEIIDQSSTTQDKLRGITAREIQRGLSAGDDMQEIVARVANKTQEQVGFRLDRIVQTAGHGAFESGQRESWLKAGIEKIDWLTQRDPRVRAPEVGDLWDHRDMDRQVVRIQEKFTVTGRGGRQERLWHPTDPRGSPGNTIYCRCTTTPVE